MAIPVRVRALLLRLHTFCGLVAGIFLVSIGLSGAIVAFEVELDHAFNPALYHVAAANASPMSIADLTARVRDVYPQVDARNVTLADPVGGAWRFSSRGSNGRIVIFVDPATGRINGARDFVTWLSTIHQFHLRLNAGANGGIAVSVAAVLVIPLVVTGLWLWWPIKRVGIATHASWRRFYFDLHNTVGFCSSIFLLVFALTGAVIGFDLVPTPDAPSAVSTPQAGVSRVGPDVALAAARHALPEASVAAIGIGSRPTDVYRVAMRLPGDLTPGGRSRVWVDQYSGQALLVDDARRAPLPTRVVTLNRAVHTGDLFGYPSKVFAVLVCLGLVAQAVTGFWLWITRR